MKVSGVTPILNVSDMQASFQWFQSIGWEIGFQWGEPVGFGSVCQSGREDGCEIFLCHNAQGGRGKGENTSTFGEGAGETKDKGVWMSLWVDDVDAAFTTCTEAGVDITFLPTDMPWNVREMHVRHPDGHVFRISQGLE